MSIWSRVGDAFKAGAKSTVDTILAPSGSSSTVAATPTAYAIDTPTASSGLSKWILPAAIAVGAVVLLRRK